MVLGPNYPVATVWFPELRAGQRQDFVCIEPLTTIIAGAEPGARRQMVRPADRARGAAPGARASGSARAASDQYSEHTQRRQVASSSMRRLSRKRHCARTVEDFAQRAFARVADRRVKEARPHVAVRLDDNGHPRRVASQRSQSRRHASQLGRRFENEAVVGGSSRSTLQSRPTPARLHRASPRATPAGG